MYLSKRQIPEHNTWSIMGFFQNKVNGGAGVWAHYSNSNNLGKLTAQERLNQETMQNRNKVFTFHLSHSSKKGVFLVLQGVFLTVTLWSRPMWFTALRTVTCHIVTHIIASTLAARCFTVTAVVVWGAYCK